MDMWTLRATRDYELYNLEVLITSRDYLLFVDTRNEDETPVFSCVISRANISLEGAQELLMQVVDNYRNFGLWIHPDELDSR